jgi:hypothetical protein
MIPAHLINGMCPTDDEPTTKSKAYNLAKGYRSRGVHAIVLEDKDIPSRGNYIIYVPVGVTLALF